MKYQNNILTKVIHCIYPDVYRIGWHSVEYLDGREVWQMGGPIVGKLSVNGYVFEGYDFGGPLLMAEHEILVPFIRPDGWREFDIAKIDLKTLTVEEFNITDDLILLYKVVDGEVYYLNSLSLVERLNNGDESVLKHVSMK